MPRELCFFVQNNYVEKLTIPVAQFAHASGIALVDRSSMRDFDVDNCGVDWEHFEPVLAYGSVQFVRKLKLSRFLAPYVQHTEDGFSAQTWSDRLPEEMLNAHGQLVMAQDIPLLLATGSMHIRPAVQDKAFHAQCFDAAAWQAVAAKRMLAPELACWASEVRALHEEWRCWVVGGEVVHASQYRNAGKQHLERGAPQRVLGYAAEVARTWLPEPCVVLDVAQTDVGLRVLEFNPIHCAGWYAADVPHVLSAWVEWARRHYAEGLAP